MPEAENLYGNRKGGLFTGKGDLAKSNAATENIPGGGFGGTGAKHPPTRDFAAVVGAAGRPYV